MKTVKRMKKAIVGVALVAAAAMGFGQGCVAAHSNQRSMDELAGLADAAQAEFYVKLGRTALSKGDAVSAATNFNKAREFDSNATLAHAREAQRQELGRQDLRRKRFGRADADP